MALNSFHNQAFTKLVYEAGEADNLVGSDPIVITEPDGASTQDGLDGAQTSVASVGSGQLEVKCWSYSNFRAWAKARKLLQRTGNHVPIAMTLLTAGGEVYALTGGAVVNTGGATTGGSEGAEHSVTFTFEEIVPVP